MFIFIFLYIFSNHHVDPTFVLISGLDFSLLEIHPVVLLIGKHLKCRSGDNVKQGALEEDYSRGLGGFGEHWAAIGVSYSYHWT